MRRRLTAAVDRRILELIRRRARRRSVVVRLLPDPWLQPLLMPSARRLRTRLLLGISGLAVVLVGVVAWIALQA